MNSSSCQQSNNISVLCPSTINLISGVEKDTFIPTTYIFMSSDEGLVKYKSYSPGAPKYFVSGQEITGSAPTTSVLRSDATNRILKTHLQNNGIKLRIHGIAGSKYNSTSINEYIILPIPITSNTEKVFQAYLPLYNSQGIMIFNYIYEETCFNILSIYLNFVRNPFFNATVDFPD